MDDLKYTIEIRHINKYLVLILFIIVICLVVGTLYYFRGTNTYYIIFVIAISLSYLVRKKLIERPISVQLYEKSLNLRFIFGKDKFIYFKDIETVSVNSSNLFVMETKSETIRGKMFPSDLSRIVADIKNVNPKLVADQKIFSLNN